MNISPKLSNLFQKLDQNHDGVSVGELKSLNQTGPAGDGDEWHLSEQEAAAAGITDAQDLATLNEALGKAKTQDLGINSVLFPADKPQPSALGSPFAQSLAQELNHGAFDPANPNLGLRLQRLESSMYSGTPLKMGKDFTMIDPDTKLSGIKLSDLDGVHNVDELRAAVRTSLGKSMGANPTDAQIDAYLSAHLDQISARLGQDLDANYNGLVKFTGDANGMTGFQKQGPDDILVCTDIHASIAAFRHAQGQEAFIVSTSDNDSAHVFTVFKDKGTWNIQNYGKVIRTGAKDLTELYDKYLPNQRFIRLFSVGDKGEIQQERKVRTATGWREWDFRNNLGAGNYDPSQAKNGAQIGTDNLGATYGRFNFNFNPQNTTLGLNYHVKSESGNSQNIKGVGVELQDHTNDAHYHTRRVDAKYESRTTTTEQPSPSHQIQIQSHVNLHAGVESTEGQPLYWRDVADGGTSVGLNDTAVRFGGLYRRDSDHLFGSGKLKLDLGHSEAFGGTGTLSATPQETSDIYQLYSGRMYNDLTAEARGRFGFVYQPSTDLLVRAGVSPGLNLGNIDGFTHLGQQARNITEASAYGEVRWTPNDRWLLAAAAQADLLHPGVFDVGGMAEYRLQDKLSWATQFHHSQDPLLGNRTSIRSDLLYRPIPQLAVTAGGGWMKDSVPMLNAGMRFNFDETGAIKKP